MTIEDLRLLTALAEAGSLAGAARRILVNHASAWRRLGALEQRLGARLFERSRTGYTPTPAGEEAIAVAQRVVTELGELERRLAGQDIRLTGIVRLTTAETLLDLLVPILAELRHVHPGIVVELVTTNAFFTLTRRDADIALRPAASAPEGLVARRLAGVATAAYATADYLKGRTDIDPLALDWLAPDDSLAHLGSARWIADHVEPDRIVHRSSTLMGLLAAARAGMGVAPLPCYLGDTDTTLRRVLPPVPEMASALFLLTHPDLRRMVRIRAVLDMLAARLTPRRRYFEGKAQK
ncbi:transcriptional regulator, LysR family [Rhizobiales bacterium GAS191]|nr:transcriptional regulator, LysR family [Rhizobiales bacterium GAS191]